MDCAIDCGAANALQMVPANLHLHPSLLTLCVFMTFLESTTMKNSIAAVAVLVSLLGGAAQAQVTAAAAMPAATAPAKAATASTDPIVVMRAEQRAARTEFNNTVRPLRAERAATIKAAQDKAGAEAKAAGKDPLVARRNAKAEATAATKADFDAKMKAATEARSAAMAAAAAKRAAAK